MRSEILPASLIEMMDYCDRKGYDVSSHKEKDQFYFCIWKKGKHLKTGEKLYKDLTEGLKEVYSKLFKAV